MRLCEYEAKQILSARGIAVPSGFLVDSPEDIKWDGSGVLKAQIPCGGRQKAGGVVFADGTGTLRAQARKLLGAKILGFRVERLLLEERLAPVRELYLGVTYDAARRRAVALLGLEGGVDVEALAEERPECIARREFGVLRRFEEHHARDMGTELGLAGGELAAVAKTLHALATLFVELDATVAEINPLIQADEGRFVAADAHVEVEDEALYRHPELERDYGVTSRETAGKAPTPFEEKAAHIDRLDYRGVAGRVIEFDGTLGLLIGGGGASLTAFDAVRKYGGHPANYCEIGGNPTVLKVKELTKLILRKEGVEKLAVITNVVSNTRVDLVARGVIKGILEMEEEPSRRIAIFRVPGSWEDEGFKILRHYGVPYCDRHVSIDEAARRAVASCEAGGKLNGG